MNGFCAFAVQDLWQKMYRGVLRETVISCYVSAFLQYRICAKAYRDVLLKAHIPYCIFALLRYGICSGSRRFCVAKAGMWWSQTGPQWGKKWTVTGPKVGHKRTRTASELYVSPRRLGSVVVQKWLWSGPEVGPKVVPAWAEPHRKSCRFFGEILLAGWSISGLAFWAIGPYNEGIYYK